LAEIEAKLAELRSSLESLRAAFLLEGTIYDGERR
jgi:hypothetical protein